MNESTEKLLTQLAEKLGTTTEYLWAVLVNQAKYDVIISLIQMVFMVAIIIATIKMHLHLLKIVPGSVDDSYSKKGWNWYKEYGDPAAVCMVFAGFLCIALVVFFLSGFNEVITGIYNPEYWALNKVMHMLK